MTTKNLKKQKFIINLLFVVFCIGLIYSVVSISLWVVDSQKTKNQMKKIAELGKDEQNIDFEALKKINPDVQGWIKIKGTDVNYPFVQSKDNSFYLNHSFNKSKNRTGWIFLDYRNSINSLDKNTIIYGHDRKDNTMLGSLNAIIKNDWRNNKENHIIKIFTEKENTTWQVFAIYHIKTTDDYLKTSFATNKDFSNFINIIKDRSVFDFNVEIKEDDKILTLSTCYSKNEKTAVHAKLINITQK